jgi:hypothetical protein
MAANPKDYAVIVGIDRYRNNAGLDPLQGAVNDAKLFYEWIIDPEGGGLDPKNATLVTSPADGPLTPNVGSIEDPIWIFFNQLYEGVRPIGRRLYLFMAGHGVNPIEGDDCSLVAADSQINPLRVLTGRMTAERVLKQPMFEEVVLFMACCRDVNTSATYCNLPMPGEPLPDAKYLHGLAVKWAKRAVEKELPNPNDPTKPPLWQSVFSHALLKSLRSAVDDHGDITSLSLKNTVKALVTTLLPPDDNRPPQFFMDEDAAPIVFKSRPPAAAAPIVEQAVPAPRGPRSPSILAEMAPGLERAPSPVRGPALRRAIPPAQPAVAAPPAGLTPVNITLSGGATAFETLDGETLAALNPPVETLADGTFRIFLKPGLYAFRVPGGQAKPVSVLGEAVSVEL